MNNPYIDQAREWAEWSKAVDQERPHTPATAAAEVILSLSDQWVDVKKLKAIIADMDHCLKMESTTDFSKGIDNATTSWRDALKALIKPQPRTLGDMTLEELKTHVGGEVMVDGWANPTMLISVIEDEGAVLAHRLNIKWPFVEVLPLTKLSPVEEPEQEAEVTSVNGAVTADSPLNERIDSLFGYDPTGGETQSPEDVPAGEVWKVLYDGHEWAGTREAADGANYPWALARLDGITVSPCSDREVILVSRLVPEVE